MERMVRGVTSVSTFGAEYDISSYQSLRLDSAALLESPTGTGKTLCLLCSALAWQNQEKVARMAQSSSSASPRDGETDTMPSEPSKDAATPPVIIYTSRTHSQLSQVIGQLRRMHYRPRHAVLGSRDHMCIHVKANPPVAGPQAVVGMKSIHRSSTDVNNYCAKLNKERNCILRNNLEALWAENNVWYPPPPNEGCSSGAREHEQPVLDIEDLIALGKDNQICPFYHSRSLVKDSELIFAPYNYLFDRQARETSLADVNFDNAILIFDEAHNLEEIASESLSFQLSSSEITACISEVDRALKLLECDSELRSSLSCTKDNMSCLRDLFMKFNQYLTSEILKEPSSTKKVSHGDGFSYPGDFIFDVFHRGLGIRERTAMLFIGFLNEVREFVIEFRGKTSTANTPNLDHLGKWPIEHSSCVYQAKYVVILY